MKDANAPLIAVVGAGLWGSAAARHLALAGGARVLLIGPEEPADWAAHPGVFASHYDEGRITRRIDTDPYWVAVSHAAMSRYAQIEADSGVAFHGPVGSLLVGAAGGGFEALPEACKAAPVRFDRLDDAGLAERFPMLHFGAGSLGFHERDGAGWISPRKLAKAQAIAAQRLGAERLVATARALTEGGGGVQIATDAGDIRVDHVVVAAGGWTETLLGRARRQQPRTRTAVLYELGPSEAARLSAMPSLVVDWPGPPDPYVLPPIRYDDGKTYLKIGGDSQQHFPKSAADLNAWFRSGGDPAARDEMDAIARQIIPGLAPEAVHMVPCVTTLTDSGYPEIAALSGRITICSGGNGAGAKNSDEMGRRGAELALEAVG